MVMFIGHLFSALSFCFCSVSLFTCFLNADPDHSAILAFSRWEVSVSTEAPDSLLFCSLQCCTTYCCMTSDSFPVVSAHCVLLFARCKSGDFGIMAALLGCLAIISSGIVPAPSLLRTLKLPWSTLLIANCPCF